MQQVVSRMRRDAQKLASVLFWQRMVCYHYPFRQFQLEKESLYEAESLTRSSTYITVNVPRVHSVRVMVHITSWVLYGISNTVDDLCAVLITHHIPRIKNFVHKKRCVIGYNFYFGPNSSFTGMRVKGLTKESRTPHSRLIWKLTAHCASSLLLLLTEIFRSPQYNRFCRQMSISATRSPTLVQFNKRIDLAEGNPGGYVKSA